MKEAMLKALGVAFDGPLADSVSEFTVINRKQGTYDPNTGTTSVIEDIYSARGVVSSYTDIEISQSGGIINKDDLKVIILSSDIGTVPETNYIVGIDNSEYTITDIKKDAVGVAYTMRVH